MRYALDRVELGWRIVLVICVVLSAPAFGQSEIGTDPTTAPVPTFDPDNLGRAIVVGLVFQAPDRVEFVEGSVALTSAPGHEGEPDMILLELLDENGEVIQRLNSWHPLWVFALGEDEDGNHDESLEVGESGPALFIVPHLPELSFLRIVDVLHLEEGDEGMELLTVHVRPIIDQFCTSNPADEVCDGVEPPVNSPPVVQADSGNIDTEEGAPVTVGATFSDPDAGDTHTATIDWGDGTPVEAVSITGGNSFSGIHVYADNGVYAVTLSVTDSFGHSAFDSMTVSVSNSPPTVEAGADQSVAVGETVWVNANFHDFGTLDTHTATIDWGDGTQEPGVVDESPFGPPGDEAGAKGAVSGSHAYAAAGEYTVTVTVIDDDGGVGSDSFIASVAPFDDPPEDPEDPEDPEEPEDPQDPVDPEDPEDPDDPVGGEGCEVGFWRNRADTDRFPGAWPPTAYASGDDLDTVFGVASGSTGLSLLAALDARGGGFNALARQAVAALLNAAHPDIGYDLSQEEVKAMLRDALEDENYRHLQNIFEDLNKQGCPIDGK